MLIPATAILGVNDMNSRKSVHGVFFMDLVTLTLAEGRSGINYYGL